MEAQEFIESGLVELAAAGLANEAEAAEVQVMRLRHPEVEQAWQEAADLLTEAAMSYAKPAPGRVRQALFDQLEREEDSIAGNTPVAEPQSYTGRIEPEAKVVTMETGTNWRYLAAASVVIALLSVGYNYVLYTRLQHAETELALAQREQTVLAASYKKATTESKQLESQLSVAVDPAMPRIKLGGMNTAKDAQLLVVWNPHTKMVQLGAKNLPAVPAGKDLQLWAIVAGKPVDLGILKMDSSGMVVEHAIPDLNGPQAFAITLEDKGGHPQPQGEMWLMGAMAN